MGYPPNCLGDHDIRNNKGTLIACAACWEELQDRLASANNSVTILEERVKVLEQTVAALPRPVGSKSE